MVCLDIHLQNQTPFTFEIRNRNDSSKSFSSPHGANVPPQDETVLKLRPESGFLGVEEGIQGSLVLHCVEMNLQIPISYDFPAVGADNFSANPSNDKIAQCRVHDNGKYGKDNPHHLIIAIGTSLQNRGGVGHQEDDVANFFRDCAGAGVKAGISAALG